MTITCKHCGEDNHTFSNDGRCWECGHLLQVVAPVARDTRTEEEKIDAVVVAAHKKADSIFPVLVSHLSTCDKFRLHEMIVGTCKKHGIVFAKRFISLIKADERFAPVVGIMSAAQAAGNF